MTSTSHAQQSLRHRDAHPWEADVLRLIGEQEAIPVDLLADLLAVDHWVAARLMNEFAGRRWVNQRQFFVNDETWVWLRKAGADRCGAPFTAAAPKVCELPHLRAACEVRLVLRAKYPEARWISQRDLLSEDDGGGQVPHAVLEIRSPDGIAARWAIGIERLERTAPFRHKLISGACERYDRVLYYCSAAIAKRVGDLPAARSPKVRLMPGPWDSVPDNFAWKLSPASAAEGTPSRPRLARWELTLLRVIAEQEAIPVDQLASIMGRDLAQANAVANHLDRSGLVRQGLGPVGEGPWLWASPWACSRIRMRYLEPSVLDGSELRLINEARRYVSQMDPRAAWVGRRRLLGGPFEEMLPAGIARSAGQEYAVEVEPDSRDRQLLIDKYERRHAEHACDGRRVLVLCSSANRRVLEELKEEHGWLDLIVEECPAFNRRPGSAKPHCGSPLQQVSVQKPPAEVVAMLEAKELERVPHEALQVKLAAERKGPGGSRWRITTERNVWGVWETPLGWWLWPADDAERGEDVLPPAPADHRKAPSPKRSTHPLVLIGLEDIPAEALRKVREQEGTDGPPEVVEAAKRRGRGSRRWRITTKRGVWLVVYAPAGWRIWETSRAEREEKAIPPPPRKRRPGKLKRELVEMKVESLPPEALQLVQVKEGLPSAPEVKAAAKTKGRGARRWRIETENDVWCVTRTPVGWWIWLASEDERAERVKPPKAPKRRRPKRRKRKPAKKEKPQRGSLVDEPLEAVPPEAIAAVQSAMGLPAPPRIKAAKRRYGGGNPRWHLETVEGWWRVTRTREHGWSAKAQSGVPDGSDPCPLDPPGTMKDIDPSELPAGGIEAIRLAARSPFPPQVRSLSKRRGKGSPRWRAVTDLGIWRVTFHSPDWKALPSE